MVVTLLVPADYVYRDLAGRAAGIACRIAAKRQADRTSTWLDVLENAVVSAVGEAFNNVVLHAYRGRHDGMVALSIDERDGELVVEVRDEGIGFDLDAVPVPKLTELPESGMGVFIMRSCMDEVSYTPGPPNVLRMRKSLGSPAGEPSAQPVAT